MYETAPTRVSREQDVGCKASRPADSSVNYSYLEVRDCQPALLTVVVSCFLHLEA